MRVSRQETRLILSLLLTLFTIPITAFADDDEPDDYDVKARVVRTSMMSGDVNIKRNGIHDWEPVRLNFPLVEGEIVATSKDSNLEIQVDARNFVRLAANSVLRIVTLRDEGIAMSVVEGTLSLRLAKFDRAHEYFEIDAPKTTLAAEKTGLYRVDVPHEGRVRLTVRDGGSARIYSDTSGFSLRDGRSAELIADGENAGDWDLLAAAAPDGIDAWVTERESYLAQRLKYDVKYFDEYVWGAEDLASYGDWNYTDQFGWIWYPRASAIGSYTDWAPYRYGHWTWCPPYGWTWVGYEPWGWAPYHYGRWVFHNNSWAWCPRSQYYRDRSWWRPALVAFSVDVNFGDDICWYPLSYYDRDPRSRHYRHEDRRRYDRPGNDKPGGDGRHGEGRRYDGDPRNWRGVTRLPRGEFGNPERRGRGVNEPVARRVFERNPERGDSDLPRRVSWGRVPLVAVPDARTGATERQPGVALDDDLRRSRVFRGREPRARDASQPATTPAATTTTTTAAPAATETQPSGAVTRPEARPRREQRTERSGNDDGPRSSDSPRRFERGERRRESTETTPTTTTGTVPTTGTETQPVPAEPAPEAPRERPRSERRERETPVNRTELAPASRPERRSESPRSDSPRIETPRTESPRSQRSESPRSEAPRSEAPRSERHDSPRSESPRSESPRSEPSRSESPRSEAPRSEAPRSEAPRSEAPRSEAPRSESPRPSAPDRPTPDKPNQIL